MEIAKKSLHRLILGIWIVMIPVTIAGMLLSSQAIGFLLGEIIGSAVATGSAFHIYHTLDVALDLDEGHAATHAKKGALIRAAYTIAILLAGMYLRKWINPIALFLGLMGLKGSVYLSPLLERCMKQKKKGVRM